MPTIVKLLRPDQYIKNGFVWLGMIFAQRWDWQTFGEVAVAFTAFCAAASAVYVFNDILDVEADRRHPVKRHRPIASGAVSPSQAWLVCAAFAVLAIVLAGFVSTMTSGLILAYLAINAAYSWRLKHVAILDVFIIAAGFMLRILAGTLGVGIDPSHWLLLTGLMLTLFLGFAKRQAELLMLANAGETDRGATRRVLDDYSPAILDLFLGVTAACTVLSYGLYTVSPETLAAHGTGALFYTVPFVIYGIFRYVFLLHRHHRGNDAAADFLADWQLMLTVLGWLVVTVAVLA
jgi:4-hydroxybenzoate polyprenyltransferase